MFVFSKSGGKTVNSDNVKKFFVEYWDGEYRVEADSIILGKYTIEDDAKKELHEIIRQIESGMTSYQLR